MELVVDLAPGASENALAVRLSERIRDNVQRNRTKAGDFRAIRGTVILVAQDSGVSLTLRFDHGRLTVHDGSIGVPSVTVCGDEAMLLRLGDVPLTRIGKLPIPMPGDAGGRAALRDVVSALARKDLTIYGLLAHPRLVLSLVRLLSTRG